MSAAVRTPTPAQIRRLTAAGVTPESNPAAHADFSVAFETIKNMDAALWSKSASEQSVSHALSYGAQLGWVARDYAGCPQLFKSLQIDLLKLVERYDTSDGFARRNAAESLVAEVKRLFTRDVLGTDSRAPRSLQPRASQPAQVAAQANSGASNEAPF
jgi:hypothetical protein